MKRKIFVIVVTILIVIAAGLALRPKDILLQGKAVIRQLNISPRVSARVEEISAREGGLGKARTNGGFIIRAGRRGQILPG